MCQSRFRANENPFEIGGVWGDVAPPARAAENMLKVSQQVRRTAKNLRAFYLDLTKNNEPCQEREGLGGGSPSSKSSRKQPQRKPRSSKNHSRNLQKFGPDPPKIDARTFLNEVQKQCLINNQQGGAPENFLKPILSNFEVSWPPRWTHAGSQDGAKIDKKKIDVKKMKF